MQQSHSTDINNSTNKDCVMRSGWICSCISKQFMKTDLSFDDPHAPLLLTVIFTFTKLNQTRGLKNDKSLWFRVDVNRFQMFQLILHVRHSDNSLYIEWYQIRQDSKTSSIKVCSYKSFSGKKVTHFPNSR